MGTFAIISLIIAIIGTVASIGTGIYQSQQNEKSVQETNAANLAAVEKTNAANAEQAELAYRRSLPVNQIRTLMDAGLSRAGALSKITGGGTYTAPVLQSGSSMASQKNLSGLMSAFDNLQGIPSNVEQSRLQEQQLSDLRQLADLREKDELRKQEQHDFDMWTKLYGKNATLMLDNLSNKIVSMAADKGINLDDIDSIDKLVNTFELDKDADWRNLPRLARTQVLDAVYRQAAENRAERADVRAENAENRAGEIHEKQLQEFADKHNMNVQELIKIRKDIQIMVDEDDARKKENAAREVEADLRKIGAELKLSDKEIQQALDTYINSKGERRPRWYRYVSPQAQRFYDMLFNVIPVSSLSDAAFKGLKLFKE